MGDASSSPCTPGAIPEGAIVLDIAEWRSLGKPASSEEYKDLTEKPSGKDRREFKRFAVRLLIRISRLGTWRNPEVQSETCETEVVAVGGALVSCRMAIDKGDMVVFEYRDFQTRSEVRYVSGGETAESMRVGLRFIASPFPESLIPQDAQPID